MQSSKVLWQFDGRLCYNVNQMHVCVCVVDCVADVSGSTDVAESSSCVCCTLISEQAEIT